MEVKVGQETGYEHSQRGAGYSKQMKNKVIYLIILRSISVTVK